MRKVLLCLGLVTAMTTLGLAEPLVLEQADNVLKAGTVEAGLSDIAYFYDYTEFDDGSGLKRTSSGFVVPLYARYAFTPRIEGFLNLPYFSLNLKDETGAVSATMSESGIGDASLGGKIAITDNLLGAGWKLGAGGIFRVPTGDKKFRQGLNIQPFVSGRRAFCKAVVNLNLSYNLTGEYETDGAPGIKINPGDALSFGAGVEHPCPVTGLNVIGEFIYQNISATKIGGASLSDSSGSRMNLLLGARHTRGNLKTKFGVDIALGEEKARTYDYRLLAGVTYLINL